MVSELGEALMASYNTETTPPPLHPPPSTPPLAVSPLAFSLAISEKLTEDNFLLWKQHIKSIIKAHLLHRYLVAPSIPVCYTSESDCLARTLNLEYQRWELQESLLLSRLQPSITASILLRLIGCVHSWQFWEKLHHHFQSKTRARARILRTSFATQRKMIVQFQSSFLV